MIKILDQRHISQLHIPKPNSAVLFLVKTVVGHREPTSTASLYFNHSSTMQALSAPDSGQVSSIPQWSQQQQEEEQHCGSLTPLTSTHPISLFPCLTSSSKPHPHPHPLTPATSTKLNPWYARSHLPTRLVLQRFLYKRSSASKRSQLKCQEPSWQ